MKLTAIYKFQRNLSKSYIRKDESYRVVAHSDSVIDVDLQTFEWEVSQTINFVDIKNWIIENQDPVMRSLLVVLLVDSKGVLFFF